MTQEEGKLQASVVEPDPTGESDEESDADSGEEEEVVGSRGVDGERAGPVKKPNQPGKKPNNPGKKPGKKPGKYNDPKENALRKEFMLMDLDNSGFVDAKDLSKATGGFIPESVFAQAIKMIDQNKDGKISFEEYKTVRKLAKTMKQAAFGGGNNNNNNNNKI